VLADFGALSSWAGNVDHSCLITEDRSGVGIKRRVQMGRSTLVETVIGWSPPAELSYEVHGLPKVIRRVVNTWRIQSTGRTTVVTLTSDVDAGHRPLQKLIAKIAGRKLGSASDEMLDGLAKNMSVRENLI